MSSRGSLALVALLLVQFSTAAFAGPGLPPSVQTQEYKSPNGIRTVHWDEQMEQLPPGPAMTFLPRPGDRSVRFEVEDLYGRNVLVYVFQEDASGQEIRHEFCAEAATVPVLSQEPLRAYAYAGICTNHNAGFATTGTVEATFSSRPASQSHPGHH